MFSPREYELPVSIKVVFPDYCIGCGVAHPETTITFGTNQTGWWTYILWTFGRRFKVQVPACARCRRSLTIRIWIHRLVLVGAAIVGVYFAGYLFSEWKRGHLKKLAMGGVAIAVVVPAEIAVCYWLPLPLDLTYDDGTVTYEFKSRFYAIEFARANGMWTPFDNAPDQDSGDESDDQHGDDHDDDNEEG